VEEVNHLLQGIKRTKEREQGKKRRESELDRFLRSKDAP
jgi:hypothetical protein